MGCGNFLVRKRAMLRNYFKAALRNLQKEQVFTLVNIIGLTVGLLACMVISTIVLDDLSYDKHWSRARDLFRIVSLNDMGAGAQSRFTYSWAGLPPELKKLYPEVEQYAAIRHSSLRLNIREGQANGINVSALEADTSVWNMLDIIVIQGNPRHYQAGTSNLLITESFRDRFFPGRDVVGEIFYDVPAYGGKPNPYLITGVIEDIPSNSHLRAEAIHLTTGFSEQLNASEGGTLRRHYLLMKPGTDMVGFTEKVNKWYRDFVEKAKPRFSFEFQPMEDIYLNSGFATDQQVKGNLERIYIFGAIAVVLLLIACINFVNLSTARALKRMRETGVRKVLGAGRKQLVMQFLAESLLVFAIAATFAFLLYSPLLGAVEGLLGHALRETLLARLPLFLGAVSVILLVSLFTGIYPAWMLSGYDPVRALKGSILSPARGSSWLRQSLVVLQFAISIIVVLGMIVVRQQLAFMQTKDIGFSDEHLLSIGYISWEGKGAAFKDELLKIPGVETASLSQWTPTKDVGAYERDVEIPGTGGSKARVAFIAGDADLGRTLGLRLTRGRLLDPRLSTDAINIDSLRAQGAGEIAIDELLKRQPALITVGTAKMMGINSLDQEAAGINVKPVGIIEDIHNRPLREQMQPLVILGQRSPEYGGMLIRVMPGREQFVSASVHDLWKRFFPDGKLLELNSVRDMVRRQYEGEEKLSALFNIFSGIAMFLAALGLFGLIVQAASQRIKEIGIRKTLGATVGSIVNLLSKDFIKLAFIAILIASPLAWYLMDRWLEDFAYRIEQEWWMFTLAGGLALLVALLTVSLHAVRAALANPVNSLRSD